MKKMTKVEKRTLILAMMHDYLLNEVSDEDAYTRWINYVPDEATDDDFREIAEDDEFWLDCVKLFRKLVVLE